MPMSFGRVQGDGNSPCGLIADLEAGRSTVLAIQSDSTGDTWTWGGTNGETTTGRWPARLVAALAQAYPAYRIELNKWNAGTSKYERTVVRAAGGEQGFVCTAAGGMRQISHIDYGYHATDLDVRVKASGVWPPAASGILVGNFKGAAGQNGWKLSIRSSGGTQLVFDYSLDGTAVSTATSSGLSLTSGATYWFRVTYDADNGAGGRSVAFSYSTDDGATWTAINTVTVATAAPIFQAPMPYEAGSVGAYSGVFVGTIYKIELRDGIDGPLFSPAGNIEAWRAYNHLEASALTGSPTLHVYLGAASGQAISYFQTNLNAMVPRMTRGACIVSTGHNESMQATTEKNVSDWLAAVKARVRYPQLFAVLQNPDLAPSSRVQHQAEFVALFGAMAQMQGYRAINVLGAFARAGATGLTSADGAHPNDAGDALWASTTLTAVRAA